MDDEIVVIIEGETAYHIPVEHRDRVDGFLMALSTGAENCHPTQVGDPNDPECPLATSAD